MSIFSGRALGAKAKGGRAQAPCKGNATEACLCLHSPLSFIHSIEELPLSLAPPAYIAARVGRSPPASLALSSPYGTCMQHNPLLKQVIQSPLVHDEEARVLPHHAVVVLVDQVVRDGVRVEAPERAPV